MVDKLQTSDRALQVNWMLILDTFSQTDFISLKGLFHNNNRGVKTVTGTHMIDLCG